VDAVECFVSTQSGSEVNDLSPCCLHSSPECPCVLIGFFYCCDISLCRCGACRVVVQTMEPGCRLLIAMLLVEK